LKHYFNGIFPQHGHPLAPGCFPESPNFLTGQSQLPELFGKGHDFKDGLPSEVTRSPASGAAPSTAELEFTLFFDVYSHVHYFVLTDLKVFFTMNTNTAHQSLGDAADKSRGYKERFNTEVD
jgi:hypothetical protein